MNYLSIPVTAIIIATSLTFFSCANDKDDETPSSGSAGEPSSSSAGGEASSSSIEGSSSSSNSSSSSSSSSLSSSSGLCAGFTNGTTRLHYETNKPQFCDERDGQKYVYITTDEQTWMAENLNYYVPNNSVCYNAETGYDYCTFYGRFYDWEAAMAACPSGWHLPTDAEWEKLIAYVEAGESQTAGIKLRTKTGWNSTGNGYKEGTDKIGFSALPGGQPNSDWIYGTWWAIGGGGLWWTATRDTGNKAPHWGTNYFNSDMWKSITHSDMGSVRCVKDN